MAYTVPNHTQTPNELFDDHMRTMTGAELKVILAICRKTFGWHKAQDLISTSQMMEMTGLSNRAVIDAIRKLMARGLVARRKIGEHKTDSYEYALILAAYEESSQATCEKSSQGSKGKAYEKSSYTKERKKNILLVKEIKNYTDDVFSNYIEN